ncbi:MAG: hypothetical protein ACXABV_09940 [Candidatus Thorarchaeota archaeon]|jgi:hypothetical protein
MKTRWMHLIAGFTMFALCISVCTTTSNAAVVWEDNFDDGNYDGWAICNNTAVNPASNWSAVNNYLRLEQKDSGTISHPSDIAYGTWSFDFKANETEVTIGRGFAIAFISNDINNVTDVVITDDWSCYWIDFRAVNTSEGFRFALRCSKWHDGIHWVIDAEYDEYFPFSGWHHIDVSRNTTGYFSVYLNGSLVLQGVDTELTTSELFVVSLSDWNMIDNVAVDEPITTTTTTTTPTTPPPPPWDPIAIGVGVAAVVIVLAIVLLRRR